MDQPNSSPIDIDRILAKLALKRQIEQTSPLEAGLGGAIQGATFGGISTSPLYAEDRPLATGIGQFAGGLGATVAAGGFLGALTEGVVPLASRTVFAGLAPTMRSIAANVLHSGIVGAGIGALGEGLGEAGQGVPLQPGRMAKEAGWGALSWAPWGAVPASRIGATAKTALGATAKRAGAAGALVGGSSAAIELIRTKNLSPEALGDIAINAISAAVLQGGNAREIASFNTYRGIAQTINESVAKQTKYTESKMMLDAELAKGTITPQDHKFLNKTLDENFKTTVDQVQQTINSTHPDTLQDIVDLTNNPESAIATESLSSALSFRDRNPEEADIATEGIYSALSFRNKKFRKTLPPKKVKSEISVAEPPVERGRFVTEGRPYETPPPYSGRTTRRSMYTSPGTEPTRPITFKELPKDKIKFEDKSYLSKRNPADLIIKETEKETVKIEYVDRAEAPARVQEVLDKGGKVEQIIEIHEKAKDRNHVVIRTQEPKQGYTLQDKRRMKATDRVAREGFIAKHPDMAKVMATVESTTDIPTLQNMLKSLKEPEVRKFVEDRMHRLSKTGTDADIVGLAAKTLMYFLDGQGITIKGNKVKETQFTPRPGEHTGKMQKRPWYSVGKIASKSHDKLLELMSERLKFLREQLMTQPQKVGMAKPATIFSQLNSGAQGRLMDLIIPSYRTRTGAPLTFRPEYGFIEYLKTKGRPDLVQNLADIRSSIMAEMKAKGWDPMTGKGLKTELPMEVPGQEGESLNIIDREASQKVEEIKSNIAAKIDEEVQIKAIDDFVAKTAEEVKTGKPALPPDIKLDKTLEKIGEDVEAHGYGMARGQFELFGDFIRVMNGMMTWDQFKANNPAYTKIGKKEADIHDFYRMFKATGDRLIEENVGNMGEVRQLMDEMAVAYARQREQQMRQGGISYSQRMIPIEKSALGDMLFNIEESIKRNQVVGMKKLWLEAGLMPSLVGEAYPEFKPLFMAMEQVQEMITKTRYEAHNDLIAKGWKSELRPHPNDELKILDEIKSAQSAFTELNGKKVKGRPYATDAELAAMNLQPQTIAWYRALQHLAELENVYTKKLMTHLYPGSTPEEIGDMVDQVVGHFSFQRSSLEYPWIVHAIKATPEELAAAGGTITDALKSKIFNDRARPDDVWDSAHETPALARKQAELLQKNGYTIDFQGKYTDLKPVLQQQLPFFTIGKYVEFCQRIGINEDPQIVKVLLDKAKAGGKLRRRMVAGWPQNTEQLTIGQFRAFESVMSRFFQKEGMKVATDYLMQIKDPVMQSYGQHFLDGMGQSSSYEWQWLNAAKKVIYPYYLARPSYFPINLTQSLYSLADIGADVGNIKTLRSANKSFGDAVEWMWAMKEGRAAKMNPDKVKYMQEAEARGLLGAQQLQFLTESTAKAMLKMGKRNVMDVINMIPYFSERINRSFTASLAYEAGKAKGYEGQKMQDYIFDKINRNQYTYGKHNVPVIISDLKNPIAKQAMSFWWMYKSFGWNTFTKMYGDLHQGRIKAFSNFLGVVGMMSGVTGLVGWQTIRYLLMHKTGKDIERMLRENTSTEVADFILKGFPSVLGVDVSKSLGIADLPSIMYYPMDYLNKKIAKLEGIDDRAPKGNPAFIIESFVDNLVRAAKYFSQGDTMRGIETMSPLAINQFMRGFRWANDGYSKPSGELLGDTNLLEEIKGSMGFMPIRISRMLAAEESYNWEAMYLQDKKQSFVDKAARALEDNDANLLTKVHQDWSNYYINAEREHRFKWSDIMESARLKRDKMRGKPSAKLQSVPTALRPSYKGLAETFGTQGR